MTATETVLTELVTFLRASELETGANLSTDSTEQLGGLLERAEEALQYGD